MDDSQKHFRLGLFVVITLVLLFGVLFILGGQAFYKPKLAFETYFDTSVAGLEIGSPVRYRGIALGTVVGIELSNSVYEDDVPHEQRKSYVIVRSELTGDEESVRDWEEHFPIFIAKGLRAQTQIAGITGQQYLSLDYIDISTKDDLPFNWTPDYAYIPSIKNSTGRIITGIQNLLANLDDAQIANLGHNINSLLVNVNKKITDIDTLMISDETVELLLSANKMINHIDNLIVDSKLDDTLANVNIASSELNSIASDPEIKKAISSLLKISVTINRMLASGGDINKILVDLDDLIKRSDAILTDNQYDLYQMIKNLTITAENLKEFSDTTKNNPSSIIFSNAPEKINLDGGN
ncbi:MCE family protein [Photobacterium sp. BZF1]|uniref:MlaD family protein n=1 Tax=Photobacterium sp. BZF1 TaxID=1904457 RepID=UPI001653E07A|nr:MlaD family protein [Photobacterium sp. BZF1]MBC7006568.1 MCE family protein [Photobacterium sp. BZF1]